MTYLSQALALAVLAGIGLATSGVQAAPPDAETEKLVADGQRLLEAKCKSCHAVGKTGDSPLAKAPPFRTLHRKYPVASLAEALAEGITTGHNEMPEFIFSPDEIAAILAYLDTIADGPAKPR